MPKWTQNCQAQLKLEELLSSGKINTNAKPSDVKHQYEEFNCFSVDNFRTHFNKTKAKMGLYRKYKKFSRVFIQKFFIILIFYSCRTETKM